MRLRKECEHGRWEAHDQLGQVRAEGWNSCPGGEFLPEGALVWVCLSARSLDGCTGPKKGPLREAHKDCGWKMILDALASQVGESER